MPKGQFTRPLRENICAVCEKPFLAKRSDKQRCDSCQQAWKINVCKAADEKRGRGTGRQLRPRICSCGTEFEAYRSDAKCPGCRIAATRARQHIYEVEHSAVCVDCGCSIVRRTEAQRCRSCAKKAEDLSGKRNPNWKGGKTSAKGYVLIRNKKPGKVSPYQGEHIVIWEQAHRQELPKGWDVHHFNGIKNDNRPDNLIALSASDHHVFGPAVRRQYEERIRILENGIKMLSGAEVKWTDILPDFG